MNVEKKISPIISANELKEIIGEPDLVLIDSSYPNGLNTFEKEHIAGAQFVDLDTDLADIKSDFANGGRHPLPSVEKFVEVLNKLGIGNNNMLVIYDRNNGAFASRMWWMMRSIGHDNVQVLDGGFDKAKEAGIELDSGEPKKVAISIYQAENWNWTISSMEDIEKAVVSENKIVIDVRGEARYRGEVEPIDTISGHIPGARNAPFAHNLNEVGTFKTFKELKNQYSQLLGDIKASEAIFHCGSGVTACHSILALEIAGFRTPSLYVGSWSEWSRNNKPIATHE